MVHRPFRLAEIMTELCGCGLEPKRMQLAEQSFYWNADGDLVLVFDEYAVAAGYMGMVEFTIPQDVYSALLK